MSVSNYWLDKKRKRDVLLTHSGIAGWAKDDGGHWWECHVIFELGKDMVLRMTNHEVRPVPKGWTPEDDAK